MDPDQLALWIAGYAALVSTGLLVVRIVEHRSGRAQVSVNTYWTPSAGDQPAGLVLTVTNKGGGVAVIRRLSLDLPGPVLVPLHIGELLVGPDLPVRLEGQTSETWMVEPEKLKTQIRKNGWQNRARGIVTLDTGKRIWEPITQYTDIH